ncbi:DUF1189 family protein [Virgibacillus alimentarius]|uniref:DUF1189 domain-containing protein n=1 Tax=Virgibacillus alimentarius TaxID=698769 RepID=A0ABS4S7I2_9BACI|nr:MULTISPECIES: DUF1189 family protein [Virgibacillus]MBP2257458.1 hypothetical protein [Virgibacillus alimentarius]HLR68759.1 DUF1189 family protein [Virgibacillus sp.]
MVFWKTFLHSLQLPSKNAMFKLNRTGMDIAVLYMFMLLLLVSVPSLIDRLTTTGQPGSDLNLLFLLIYFFIFYYLPMTVIVFLLLSFVAYIGTWIAKFMQRKLKFPLLFKMCAYISTVPFILYTIVAILFPIDDTFLWFALLYTFIFLVKMITVYPKRRVR